MVGPPTDQAVASENLKDTAAAVVNMVEGDRPGTVAANTGAADAKDIGAAAGKTSATSAADMAIR